MRKRHFLRNLFYALAIILILVPLVSCSALQSTTTQIKVPVNDQKMLREYASVQVDARESAPEVNVTTTTQKMSLIDGRSIIENNCARCHLVQSLLQSKKSRTEWEGALQQMELMGIHLNVTERVVLLDYLATKEEP
jgi:hypothetical protein